MGTSIAFRWPDGAGAISAARATAAAILLAGSLSACETAQGNLALGALGATVLGAQSPNNEIEQVYYLGSFDPQGQLPPQLYRIRVHGQASAISFTRFSSGWVPAPLIDSLSSAVGYGSGKAAGIALTPATSGQEVALGGHRRLFQFGPEGIREAPEGHRLVVVMGSSPEDFFNAIDTSLGAVSEARFAQRENQLTRKLFEALVQLRAERDRLADVQRTLDLGLGAPR